METAHLAWVPGFVSLCSEEAERWGVDKRSAMGGRRGTQWGGAGQVAGGLRSADGGAYSWAVGTDGDYCYKQGRKMM